MLVLHALSVCAALSLSRAAPALSRATVVPRSSPPLLMGKGRKKRKASSPSSLPPSQLPPQPLSTAATDAYISAATSVPPPTMLPTGWQEYQDASSGRVFFSDGVTSQWERPAIVPPPAALPLQSVDSEPLFARSPPEDAPTDAAALRQGNVNNESPVDAPNELLPYADEPKLCLPSFESMPGPLSSLVKFEPIGRPALAKYLGRAYPGRPAAMTVWADVAGPAAHSYFWRFLCSECAACSVLALPRLERREVEALHEALAVGGEVRALCVVVACSPRSTRSAHSLHGGALAAGGCLAA